MNRLAGLRPFDVHSVVLGVAAVLLLSLALSGGAALGASGRGGSANRQPSGRESRACHVPRLTGLTVSVARKRAAKSRCTIRLQGARVTDPRTQTVRRQMPAHGLRESVVSVWVNPLCTGSGAAGPGIDEPLVTTGPTELISGLYVVGGPLAIWSEPRCEARTGEPGAGTITVREPATGSVLAMQTVAGGQLARIPLAPGMYTVQGTFANATENGHAAETFPQTVKIEAGRTVRQDAFLDVP